MMINTTPAYPIDLDTLKENHPDRLLEVLAMPIEVRRILFCWLNGQTSSPVGYGFADCEFTKEDAYSSALKTEYGIDFESLKVEGKRCLHRMRQEQIHSFFYDRDAQRRMVMAKVWAERTCRDDATIRRILKRRKVTWLLKRVGELAANDPCYEKADPQ